MEKHERERATGPSWKAGQMLEQLNRHTTLRANVKAAKVHFHPIAIIW